jgi:uncharacterized protein
MPVSPTYPGVYIQEIPSGVRTIVGVATSVTAFVGRALRGPENEPTTINNFGDFERIFGGLWSESTLSYAVRDFYLNGGGQAIIVRLYNPDFADEATRLAAFTAALTRATTSATAVRDAAQAAVGATAIKAAATASAAIQSAGGDIAAITAAEFVLGVIRDTADGSRPLSEVGTDTTAAALVLTTKAAGIKTKVTSMVGLMRAEASTAALISVGQGIATAEADAEAKAVLQSIVDTVNLAPAASISASRATCTAEETQKNATQDRIIAAVNLVRDKVIAEIGVVGATLSSVASAANAERDAQTSVDPTVGTATASLASSVNAATLMPPNDTTIKAAATASITEAANAGANAFAPRPNAELTFNGLSLVAKYPGAWGNELQARISTDTESRNDGSDPKSFNLYVRDGNTGKVESYLDVSTDSTKARYINEVLTTESLLVTNENTPSVVTPSEPVASLGVVADRDAWTSTNSNSVLEANYGSDGLELQDVAYSGSRNAKTGIYALENVEQFNLLCIPPRTFTGDLGSSVIDSSISYCTERRAFMIIDPALSWKSKDQAKAGMVNPGFAKSDYAAIFFPRLVAKDPMRGNRLMNFAPCGVVAGIMARTDTNRGIWKAPAGLDANILGYPEVEVKLTDAENGELNPIGLNCIRSTAVGRIVWGSRTMRGDDRFASEYKYVPVRRTALHIENSLFRGLQWVVFEPNDEPLWAQIRLNVGAFMQGLFRQGAFEGKTPAEAYFVKCDSETTTATDRNLGVVNIIVGFAPLKPAEFVILSLQQMAKQES